MDISPRLRRTRVRALRGIERQLLDLDAQDRKGPLGRHRIERVGDALTEAGAA